MTLPSCASFLAATLALASSAARADSNMNMPEGSKDITYSMTAFDAPRSEGGTRRQFGALPSFTGRWSNGIFAALGEVGMDLSDDPVLDWGPLVTYDLRQRRTDDPSDKGGLDVEGGVFAHYLFAYNINFNAAVLYGGGADRSGVKLLTNADFTVRLGPHASLNLSPGLEFVNASYMKSSFGITPAQSANDHLAPYVAHPGLKSVNFGAAIDWQMTNKWSLTPGINTSMLVGSAAHSPLTERRTNSTIYLQLGYHY
jgi:outer membrane scaffolding protein for murein synthesis (MipA/OmpV family)